MNKQEVLKQGLNMLSQLIPVALGVYLGIIASNWNDQRNQAALQQVFLQNLYLELSANQQKLKEASSYHEAMFQLSSTLLDHYSADTLQQGFWSLGGWRLLPGWEGLKIPTLESSVYETGTLQNTLLGLDFATINTIAQVYNLQGEYLAWANKLIFDRITTIKGNATTREAINNLQQWYDVTQKGQTLEKDYERLLILLKAR
ncbi:MAG: hypothetical protein RIG62_23170 [Cyclobacteriaceae bacterium]